MLVSYGSNKLQILSCLFLSHVMLFYIYQLPYFVASSFGSIKKILKPMKTPGCKANLGRYTNSMIVKVKMIVKDHQLSRRNDSKVM